MRVVRYRGRHLKARPKNRGPIVVGTAAAMWMSSSSIAQAGTHTVRSGETLSAIAAKYGTSVTALVKANDIDDPNLIVAGQKLKVPGRVVAHRIHRVKSGETLSGIAAKYGISVTRLAKINRIKDPSLIVVGQRLKVPSSPRKAGTRQPSPAPARNVGASLHGQSVAHHVNPALVKALAWVESGWKQNVVSSAGAVGVMQVMPATGRYVNVVLGGGGTHDLNIRKMDDNVHAGVMYLRHLLEVMPNERKALAGYYAGPGNVKRKLTKNQRWYARTVQSLKKRF